MIPNEKAQLYFDSKLQALAELSDSASLTITVGCVINAFR